MCVTLARLHPCQPSPGWMSQGAREENLLWEIQSLFLVTVTFTVVFSIRGKLFRELSEKPANKNNKCLVRK